jgi:hypothetical protein
LAVERLSPGSLFAFSTALMQNQRDFFDVSVVNETRNQTYARLAALAEESVSINRGEMLGLLQIADQPDKDGALNIGNKVCGLRTRDAGELIDSVGRSRMI